MNKNHSVNFLKTHNFDQKGKDDSNKKFLCFVIDDQGKTFLSWFKNFI